MTDAHAVILTVTHNSAADLPRCLDSLTQAEGFSPGSPPGSPPESLPCRHHILIVDCASTDGTPGLIASRYPHVQFLPSNQNLGFAGGNNLGFHHLLQTRPAVQYLALLNPDTVVDPHWLAAAIDYLAQHPGVAGVQSKILLLDEQGQKTNRFNSTGNRSHYLGFGFVTALDEEDHGQHDLPGPIDFASGAACVYRVAPLREHGLFDPAFFMYLEDMDLGWKLRAAGHEVHYCPASVVWHRYHFGGVLRHYEHYERNRLTLLLTWYRKRTLVLLLPAILLMELVQWGYALRHGLLPAKLRSYRGVRRRSTPHYVSRAFLRHLSANLDVPAGTPRLIAVALNGVLAAWWRLVHAWV
jgi:GT2 family glycosyltransferase